MRKYYLLTTVIVISFVFILLPFITNNKVNALSGSDFQAGRIIDDAIFTNKDSMSITQIQQFLNSKMPNCEVWHTAYNASNPPPYTCLKDYQENPTTGDNNFGRYVNNAPYQVPGGKSSAQIIWEAGQAYNINPQVLIVLLQKEQALVTDTWPLKSQFTKAMGYLCPDTAPCSASAGGFYKQVFGAAWQFRHDFDGIDTPGYWSPYGKGINNVLYSPISSCGTRTVNITTQATAVLYKYTPYTPNDAALAVMNDNTAGGTVNCGAYGNRNFFWYFTKWFGSTTSIENIFSMSVVAHPDNNVSRGEKINYTISFTSKMSYPITVDAVGIVGRLGDINSGKNSDMGWQGPITLAPGVTQQYDFNSIIKDVGTITVWPAVFYSGQYVHFTNSRVTMNSHSANISLTSPLSINPANPIAGQVVTLSASIKNNELKPIIIDAIGIPIRYYGKYGYDVAWTNGGGSILPGQTINLSGTTVFDKPGPYTSWVSWNLAGSYTSLSDTISTTVSSAIPNFSLSYVEYPNQNPSVGEDVAIKFKLKNNSPISMTLDAIGVVGRYGNPYNGPNRDFGWLGPVTFAPGEEKTYSGFYSNVSELNNFYAWVAIKYKTNYIHYNNWGFMLVPHNPSFTLNPNLTINSGVPISKGQTVNSTFTIKNNEQKPIRYSAIGIPIKYYGVYSYDTGWSEPGVLAASGQSGDTLTISGFVNFDKTGPYVIWPAMVISNYNIPLDSKKTIEVR